MTTDAIDAPQEPLHPRYDSERRRRFFNMIGDRALSRLIRVDDTGRATQPSDSEEDEFIERCLDLYRQFPAEDDELGAELSALVAAEVLKTSLRVSNVHIVDKVSSALQVAHDGGISGDTWRFNDQARAAVSFPRTSALNRVANQVRDILQDGESYRPVIPEKTIESLNDDLHNTIINIMHEGHIKRRDAVGLILACGLKDYSDNMKMKIEQSIAKDRIVSSIQAQLADRTFNFDVSTLQTLMGYTEQTKKTRSDVISIVAIKYGLSFDDADKVVSAELAHDLKIFFQVSLVTG